MKLLKVILMGILSAASAFNINRRDLVFHTPAILSVSLNSNSESESELEPTYLQEDSNKIYFYGPVTSQSCFMLRTKINELTHKSNKYACVYDTKPFPIHLHIQSSGGSLFSTIYILDLIRNQDKTVPIYTFVDGFAASAATLMSVVGSKRYITKNSLMLIHQLSAPTENGKYAELQDQMHNMDSLMRIIINVYKENTNMTDEDLIYLLQKDIWLNSTECLKYGLVDEII